jgi:hypothetical protein
VVFDYPTPVALADYLLGALAPADTVEPELEPGEADVRRALREIPLARLREAGLLDVLIDLGAGDGDGAGLDGGPGDEDDDGDGESIDSMDLASLVKRSLEGASADPGEEPA